MIVILVSLFLITLSALFSGLNLGLMSLDVHELRRKAEHGNKQAAKVYAVRENGNLLLVSLLLGNVATISGLSLVLETVFAGVLAGLLTTALITMFGEIIPQALFSRYALSFGAKLTWFVKGLLIILWPVAAPIAYALNKALGDELPTIYGKAELAHIIKTHGAHTESDIDRDEVRIATGALTFGDKRVASIMTPKAVVNGFSAGDIIDETCLRSIRENGNSRFPVFGPDHSVVGVLFAKDLLHLDSYTKTAKQLARKKVRTIGQDDKLDDALNHFIKDRQHLFVVVNKNGKYVGIVTLEDIIEEILKREIVDEYDKHVDMRRAARNGN